MREGWGGVVETKREKEKRRRKERGVATRGAYVQWLVGDEVKSQKISLKEGNFFLFFFFFFFFLLFFLFPLFTFLLFFFFSPSFFFNFLH